MRTLVLNSEPLRRALSQANRTARLKDDEWKALLGLKMRLEAHYIKERRAALSAALEDSRLPLPLRGLIRMRLDGTDFTDQELQGEIKAARAISAKADEEANRAAVAAEREVIPNSEVRMPDVSRDSDAQIVDDIAHGAAFKGEKAED